MWVGRWKHGLKTLQKKKRRKHAKNLMNIRTLKEEKQ